MPFLLHFCHEPIQSPKFTRPTRETVHFSSCHRSKSLFARHVFVSPIFQLTWKDYRKYTSHKSNSRCPWRTWHWYVALIVVIVSHGRFLSCMCVAMMLSLTGGRACRRAIRSKAQWRLYDVLYACIDISGNRQNSTHLTKKWSRRELLLFFFNHRFRIA